MVNYHIKLAVCFQLMVVFILSGHKSLADNAEDNKESDSWVRQMCEQQDQIDESKGLVEGKISLNFGE